MHTIDMCSCLLHFGQMILMVNASYASPLVDLCRLSFCLRMIVCHFGDRNQRYKKILVQNATQGEKFNLRPIAMGAGTMFLGGGATGAMVNLFLQ